MTPVGKKDGVQHVYSLGNEFVLEQKPLVTRSQGKLG